MESPARLAQYFAYWAIFFFVLTVSCVDLYLIVRYQSVMQIEEKNDVGLWLISLDGDSVGAFCALKMFGTCLALGVFKKIWMLNRKWGWTIGGGLCAAQTALLCYLFL